MQCSREVKERKIPKGRRSYLDEIEKTMQEKKITNSEKTKKEEDIKLATKSINKKRGAIRRDRATMFANKQSKSYF